MSEFLSALRRKSEQAIETKLGGEAEEMRRQKLEREQNEADRNRLIAAFVAEKLPTEVALINAKAEEAAAAGEFSYIREWQVKTHIYERGQFNDRRKLVEEVDPEVVVTESEKIVQLRSKLQEHYQQLGLHTNTSESVDGFYVEIPDYGRDYNETHKIFRLQVWWQQISQGQEAPAQ